MLILKNLQQVFIFHILPNIYLLQPFFRYKQHKLIERMPEFQGRKIGFTF